ncbi:hypothetical protein [Pseudomonas bohemica]|uniref:hypothetical protein n=1 Tax=Pseudomonas bohemica TaxID=2044872 RepID=UPI000DA609C0|nr:hypothetical protein [Pseudomonas bohemica]
MTNKTEMVSVPRELLERAVKAGGAGVNAVDLVDAWRAVATLMDLLAAPAEDVRAVGDEPVLIQAVAVTREDEDEGLRLEWLLEGGISELEFAGTVLFAMPEANDLCDEDGSAEVYRHPRRPVVLPERKREFTADGVAILENLKWNACLDEISRLNP